jgi:hypothetical protein
MDNLTPLQEIQSEYKSNQNSNKSLTQKNSNKLINFILLVLYSLYSLFLLDFALNNTFQNGVSGILLMFLFPIYLFVFLYFAWAIISLLIAIFSNKINIVALIPMFSVTGIIIALSLLGDWDILPKIIGVIIILLSAYKIYTETQLLNNKRNQNSYVLKSENNNLYQNIKPNTTTSPDTYTNTQSNTPTPEVQNIYQQASMNNTPKVNFDTQSLSNQNNTSPSSITESIQEIKAEYKSNQNPEENLAQKIQEHYQPELNSQKIVSEPNPNKFRNLFFSVLLILGFLAFAVLSIGGIVVGDLTISGVLAVGSVILVIDGYLFYLMWFKK